MTAPSEGGADSTENNTPRKDNSAYWKANISLLLKLMVIWFVVSFGCDDEIVPMVTLREVFFCVVD